VKSFKSEYPKKLFKLEKFEGGTQAVFTSKYLEKLIEVKISDDPIIEPYSGLVLGEIVSEGPYKGFYIELDEDF
jgi:hypothetical protein